MYPRSLDSRSSLRRLVEDGRFKPFYPATHTGYHPDMDGGLTLFPEVTNYWPDPLLAEDKILDATTSDPWPVETTGLQELPAYVPQRAAYGNAYAGCGVTDGLPCPAAGSFMTITMFLATSDGPSTGDVGEMDYTGQVAFHDDAHASTGSGAPAFRSGTQDGGFVLTSARMPVPAGSTHWHLTNICNGLASDTGEIVHVAGIMVSKGRLPIPFSPSETAIPASELTYTLPSPISHLGGFTVIYYDRPFFSHDQPYSSDGRATVWQLNNGSANNIVEAYYESNKDYACSHYNGTTTERNYINSNNDFHVGADRGVFHAGGVDAVTSKRLYLLAAVPGGGGAVDAAYTAKLTAPLTTLRVGSSQTAGQEYSGQLFGMVITRAFRTDLITATTAYDQPDGFLCELEVETAYNKMLVGDYFFPFSQGTTAYEKVR